MLTVTDLRQHAYCPRVVYFTYVQPLEHRASYKMQHGLRAEEQVATLERRRTLARYGLQEGERLFSVALEAAELGLRGVADLLILTPDSVCVVEFKETDEGLTANHRLQVAAYALMAEERYARPAPAGFVCHLPEGRLWRVTVGEGLRGEVRRAVGEVEAMLRTERFPEPPRQRGKCRDCEFRRFCGDV